MQRRLDYMLFVGLTEKHQESATIFFSLVADQAQVQSKAMQEILGQNASVPGLMGISSSFLLWIWSFSFQDLLLRQHSCVLNLQDLP